MTRSIKAAKAGTARKVRENFFLFRACENWGPEHEIEIKDVTREQFANMYAYDYRILVFITRGEGPQMMQRISYFPTSQDLNVLLHTVVRRDLGPEEQVERIGLVREVAVALKGRIRETVVLRPAGNISFTAMLDQIPPK